MKFTVPMKTPDAVYYAIDSAIDSEMVNRHISDADGSIRMEMRLELEVMLSKWFKFGECATIEIDTDNETASVLEL